MARGPGQRLTGEDDVTARALTTEEEGRYRTILAGRGRDWNQRDWTSLDIAALLATLDREREATAAAEQRLRSIRAGIEASIGIDDHGNAVLDAQAVLALLDSVAPEDRPARCAEEGCVRTPGHVGAHTSRPYWPRELRDELALEPFTKVVVGIYDPATQQTETIVGDSASPRQGEPQAALASDPASPSEPAIPLHQGAASPRQGEPVERLRDVVAAKLADAEMESYSRYLVPGLKAALDAMDLRAALSEPAEAGEP